MSEMPYLLIEDLTVLFGYKNKESALRAISRGTFPVSTQKIAGRRVADREMVREYFRRLRAESLAELNRA